LVKNRGLLRISIASEFGESRKGGGVRQSERNPTPRRVVVTKYPQVGNGIDFTQMHPNDSRRLGEFISQHQQECDAASAGA
jgi:hypothetical protein